MVFSILVCTSSAISLPKLTKARIWQTLIRSIIVIQGLGACGGARYAGLGYIHRVLQIPLRQEMTSGAAPTALSPEGGM